MEKVRSRYAIAAGNIELVSDGVVGNHSPFTKSLVDFLAANVSEKLPVSHLYVDIRKRTTYNAHQTPVGGHIMGISNPGGEFVFNLKKSKETSIWQQAKKDNSLSAYENYLKKFPNGKYVTEAQSNIVLLTSPSQEKNPSPKESFKSKLFLMTTLLLTFILLIIGFLYVRNYIKIKNYQAQYITESTMFLNCLLYTSPSPRDQRGSRMPSSA